MATYERPGLALEMRQKALRNLQSPANESIIRSVLSSSSDEDTPYSAERRVRDKLRVLAYTVQEAEPVYWTQPLCGLLDVASATLPDWTLREEDLICPQGFAWFASPWQDAVPMPKDPRAPAVLRRINAMRTVACSWGLLWTSPDAPVRDVVTLANHEQAVSVDASPIKKSKEDRGFVQILFWGYHGVNNQLLPYSWTHLEVGMSFDHITRRVHEWAEASSGDDEYLRAAHISQEEDRLSWENLLTQVRYFACALALMNQRIITTTRVRADRASRHAAAQLGHPVFTPEQELVRMVHLRRREQPEHTDDPEHPSEVEWSCRWLVRGHWRQQYIPGQVERRPTWIAPYAKGPEGKPLRYAPERLWVVAR